MDKAEWLTGFINAYNAAFARKNILRGWVGIGLHPFNPQKVLGYISIPPLPEDIPLLPESTYHGGLWHGLRRLKSRWIQLLQAKENLRAV